MPIFEVKVHIFIFEVTGSDKLMKNAQIIERNRFLVGDNAKDAERVSRLAGGSPPPVQAAP